MTLNEFVDLYIASRDISDGYAEQLGCLVHAVERLEGRPIKLLELDADLVNRHLKSTRDVLAPETRKSRRKMFLTVWQGAADAGLLAEPPRRKIMNITVPDKLQCAWTVDQVRQLLHVCSQIRGYFPNDIKRSLYWSSYVMAAWDSGLRGVDLRRLHRLAITADGACVLIQHKTGRRLRIKFRPATVQAIDATFPPDRDFCFPLWGRLETWRRAAKKLVTLAGVGGHIGQLRHSSGTAVEIQYPGHGHEHLGNTRQVFEKHYLDHEKIAGQSLLPPAIG